MISTVFGRIERLRPESVFSSVADQGLKNWQFVTILVALFTFPLIFLKEYHFEEGLGVIFATEALNGNVFYPKLYGFEFTERPVMMSWLISLVSLPFGEVSEFTARLPVVVALVLGGCMILRLVEQYTTRRAAIFAVFAFVCSPLVIKKVVTAEPDIVLSVLQFSAFVLWWDRYRAGRVGLLRWALIGLILAIVGAFKGPQPAAFFAIGIGVFHLINRDWRELAGFAMAGIISLGLLATWYLGAGSASGGDVMLDYMRLRMKLTPAGYLYERLDLLVVGLAQFMPVPLILIPAWVFKKKGSEKEPSEKQKLIGALSCYSLIVTLVLFFWPGANVRYAMPALLGLVVISGLKFEQVLEKGATWARIACFLVLAVAAIQVIKGWVVSPINHRDLSKSRTSAAIVDSVLKEREEDLFVEFRKADAVLAYMEWEGNTTYVDYREFSSIELPAFFLTRETVFKENPELFADMSLIQMAALPHHTGLILLYAE